MKPGLEGDYLYIGHVLECIENVEEYTEGDRELFDRSRLVQDAVIRNLQTMAESTQRLSDETRSALGEIPWRKIAGFRNVLVHDYLGVDLDVIWGVIENHLLPLKDGLEARLLELDQMRLNDD